VEVVELLELVAFHQKSDLRKLQVVAAAAVAVVVVVVVVAAAAVVVAAAEN
jgi:hypothetical protein